MPSQPVNELIVFTFADSDEQTKVINVPFPVRQLHITAITCESVNSESYLLHSDICSGFRPIMSTQADASPAAIIHHLPNQRLNGSFRFKLTQLDESDIGAAATLVLNLEFYP